MQSSVEQHLAVKRNSQGSLSVQDVECARVYHVNTVMEIRTQVRDMILSHQSCPTSTCCSLLVTVFSSWDSAATA